MNPSSFKSTLSDCRREKRKGAFAKPRSDDAGFHHIISGTLLTPQKRKKEVPCSSIVSHQPTHKYDIYANWDEDLIHLLHTIQPFKKQVPFPNAKPLLFTGCRLENGEEVEPISMKLSFREKEGKLEVCGDGMVDLVHFEVTGWVTKTQDPDEYQIELAVTKAGEVGG